MPNKEMFEIANNKKDIVSTNYFKSSRANEGLMFLTCSAGAFRLLMPDQHLHCLSELKRANSVIITRGKYESLDVIEIMFEDETQQPVALHISCEQCDREFPTEDSQDVFEFSLWTRLQKEFSVECRYRYRENVPYLKKWGE
jgi:hypothetical protein